MRVQWHRHANPQDPRPHLNPRRTSELGSLTTHDDTAASMCFELECLLCACKPAKLEVRIRATTEFEFDSDSDVS